jgi:hypothetical protein
VTVETGMTAETKTEETTEVQPVFELDLVEIRTPGPLKQQGN